MRTYLVSSTFVAVLLLFASYAKADLVANYFDAKQKEAYLELADASEWSLVGSAEFDKAKAPYDGVFTLTNTLDEYRADDQKVGNREGNYSLDNYSGRGSGYTNTLTGVGDYVGMVFSHNSANTSRVEIPEGLIDSFFVNVATHANENSTEGTYNITLYTTEGTQTFTDIEFGWAGFILEEGVFLTGFEITQNSNPNTGFTFDFVPGDGTALTPEPASMFIFAIALVGLIAFVRIRKPKLATNES